MQRRMIAALVTALVLVFWSVAGHSGLPLDDIKKADRHFEDHDYKLALKSYREALSASSIGDDDRGHAFLRVGECLKKLKEFDEALEHLNADETRFRGSIWGARVKAMSGSIRLTMPHWYYQKGNERSRTNWIQGAEYHYTYYDDVIAAMTDIEEASIRFRPHLVDGVNVKAKELKRRVGEFVRAMTEMSQAIEAHRNQKGGFDRFEIVPEVLADYKKHRIGRYFGTTIGIDGPQRFLKEAESVAKRHGFLAEAALARYLDGMSLRRLLAQFSLSRVDSDWTTWCRFKKPDQTDEIVSFPPHLNAFQRMASVLADYGKQPIAATAAFAYGRMCADHGLYLKALEVLDGFEDRYKTSPWRSDVSSLRQQITYPRLSLADKKFVLPGKKVSLDVSGRNVATIAVTVKKVDLETVYGSRTYLRDGDTRFNDIRKNLSRSRSRRSWIDAVKPFVQTTPDKGEHKPYKTSIDIPLTDPGAYLVEASGGGVVYRSLLLVSNLVLTRKVSTEETILMAVDATTGAPKQGANVVVKQVHRADGVFGDYNKATSKKGETGEDGLFVRRHETSERNSIYLEAFAKHGDHFAFTHWDDARTRVNPNSGHVVYGFTDRPVYRPDETVNFVANLRRRDGFDYVTTAAEKVSIRIFDAKGNKIFEEVRTTDEYGAVHGKINVGSEPPLGNYRIDYRVGRRRIGRTAFRIEEYKKPEFEVMVAAEGQQFRIGEPIKIKIHGEYYSGGGVPNAKVSYRVFRSRFSPRFRVNEPYRYLYGMQRHRHLNTRGSRGDELVITAEGETDENGDLMLDVATDVWQGKYPGEDHTFRVDADMMDLSRRTISGSGSVRVTRKAVFCQVTPNRGFYRSGEQATFEIQTQNAAGSPVKTDGRFVIYRVTQTVEDGNLIVDHRTQIHSEPVTTGSTGLGLFKWTADAAGRFAVTYVTQDQFGEAVVGEVAVWVAAPDFKAHEFQFKNIEVITDKAEYKPGETAYIMMNSNFEGATAFVTLEAGREIIKWEVIRFDGKTHVMALDINESHSPNMFLNVILVRNGAVFQSTTEIFVPPTHKFLDVAMKFDREEYGPGDRAKLRLQSLDDKGRGVPAQFAVRVMDKSITYIQQDTTQDIRAYFYGSRRSFAGGSRWNTNTQSSVGFNFSGYQRLAPAWTRFRQHGTPPGWELDFGLGANISAVSANTGKLGFWGSDDLKEAETSADTPFDGRNIDGAIGLGAPASARLGSELTRAVDRNRSSGSKAKKAERPFEETDDHAAPELRTDFSDLALWDPMVRTDSNGRASIDLSLPDSLTTWVATARGLSKNTLVGQAETETRTSKNILVRLQAPRFFTETDRIVLSGVIRNDFEKDVAVTAQLEVAGNTLELIDPSSRVVAVKAGREVRVDWRVNVKRSGTAHVLMKALSDDESDAVVMEFPVLAYGIDKVVTQNMVMDGDDHRAVTIDLPEARGAGSAGMEVTLSPSLAGVMLDSLPYLVEYPYGCTEQTMSRFMPAAVVAATMKEAGISLDDVAKKRIDLDNKSKLGGLSPVYSGDRLNDIVKAGVRRLVSMQNSDGGFGWWRLDRSSTHLTAYVLWGLVEAKKAGFDVPQNSINRAAGWLEAKSGELTQGNLAAFSAFSLATAGRKPTKLLAKIYEVRDELNIYGKAQLALAMHRAGKTSEAQTVSRNLADFVREDRANGTCHWDGSSSWWYWHGDQIETNAMVLLALAETMPNSPYLQPLSRWIVNNRSGNRWKSTRDTALCVLGLAKYMKQSGELDPQYEIEVAYGDTKKKMVVDRDNMFSFENKFIIADEGMKTGTQSLSIVKKGKGRLYVNVRTRYFSKEEKIKGAGHEIFVKRSYALVKEVETEVERNGKKVMVLKKNLTPIEDLSTVAAGSEIEVKLTVESKNDYEYIMLEDRKPAGFEPVALRSGGRYANGLCSNMELRDEKVVFFVTWMQQGTHEITYRVRAEVPGTVHAMPCRAVAMYAPKLGSISDSWTFGVTDTID